MKKICFPALVLLFMGCADKDKTNIIHYHGFMYKTTDSTAFANTRFDLFTLGYEGTIGNGKPYIDHEQQFTTDANGYFELDFDRSSHPDQLGIKWPQDRWEEALYYYDHRTGASLNDPDLGKVYVKP